MAVAIGIDLGTTFSAVSIIDENEQPIILKNTLDENLTPSVIYFESEKHTIVGSEAKEMQAFGEDNVASFFKRSMGDPNYVVSFFGKTFTPTDLSSILLKKLKDDAEKVLLKKINYAVITVPAYFSDPQRKATLKAAENIGLDVLRIVNEPTAAAISFGINQNKNQKLLVYDLGGGTFDVTVMNVNNGTIEVLSTGGDHELGGKEWDNRLISYIANQFEEEFHEDPLSDNVSFNDLLVKAENAKRHLSSVNSVKVSISFNGNKASYEITRAKFEEITVDLLQSTALKAEEILVEANLTWEDLGGVLLVGGSTRMPMVSDWVKKFSGKNPLKGVNVDEAVCFGAAIMAEMELKRRKNKKSKYTLRGIDISVKDVMSHSLGLIAENSDRTKYINSILIEKNIPIPASETRPYQLRTGRNRNNTLEVYLTQGETENIGECEITGKYIFDDIDHIEKGLSIIDIDYKYDANGTIDIEATQRENNKKLNPKEVEIPTDMSWIDRSPEIIEETIISHISVVIAIDVSGSMSGTPLEEAQKAANKFIEKMDLSNASVALMPFADRVEVNRQLTQNAKKLRNGIAEWNGFMGSGGVGWGNSAHPFDKSLEILNSVEGRRFIIVLADGVWSYQDKAIARAKICAEQDIEIIAIGFGGADKKFLKAIATSDENALFTNLESLVSSFSNIAQVLTETGGDFQSGTTSDSKKGFLNFLKQ